MVTDGPARLPSGEGRAAVSGGQRELSGAASRGGERRNCARGAGKALWRGERAGARRPAAAQAPPLPAGGARGEVAAAAAAAIADAGAAWRALSAAARFARHTYRCERSRSHRVPTNAASGARQRGPTLSPEPAPSRWRLTAAAAAGARAAAIAASSSRARRLATTDDRGSDLTSPLRRPHMQNNAPPSGRQRRRPRIRRPAAVGPRRRRTAAPAAAERPRPAGQNRNCRGENLEKLSRMRRRRKIQVIVIARRSSKRSSLSQRRPWVGSPSHARTKPTRSHALSVAPPPADVLLSTPRPRSTRRTLLAPAKRPAAPRLRSSPWQRAHSQCPREPSALVPRGPRAMCVCVCGAAGRAFAALTRATPALTQVRRRDMARSSSPTAYSTTPNEICDGERRYPPRSRALRVISFKKWAPPDF